jgi:exo-beta-1,3-glucanase (GH17 family)
MGKMIRIFVSYSHNDSEWLSEKNPFNLLPSLAEFFGKDVEFWYDPLLGKRHAGEDYAGIIHDQIAEADFAILLLSNAYVSSNFIRTTEIRQIKDLFFERKLRIIPILVGPVTWGFHHEFDWILDKQMLPSSNTPLCDYTSSKADWERVKAELIESLRNVFLIFNKNAISPAPGIGSNAELRSVDEQKTQPRIEERERMDFSPRKKNPLMKYLLLIGAPLVAVLLFILLTRKEAEAPKRCDAMLGAAPWLSWILYDPVDLNPEKGTMPSEASIREDIVTLKRYGFDGLITVTSKGTCRHIARIAHEEGMNKVIVGVWNLRDKEEVENALSASEWADAYCLGNNGLNRLYSRTELLTMLEEFRRKTGRCVTTTLSLVDYTYNPDIVKSIDFLFPHVFVMGANHSPEKVYDSTLKIAHAAAATFGGEKLIMLKWIMFPSGGGRGYTPETQRDFYRLIIEKSMETTEIPSNVILSFMCAFDPVWKTSKRWADLERYTGLFTADRKAKPAVLEVEWRKRHR